MSNTNNLPPLKEAIAQDLHKVFLDSMEVRYKEILSFLGFILPALTGFVWIVNNYEISDEPLRPVNTFFIGTLSVMGILFWGAVYSLAVSYRYRYLQASVYKIEEACGADIFIPQSFKPRPLEGFKVRAALSMAPGILQIHVFFFMCCIIAVSAFFTALTSVTEYSMLLMIFAGFCIAFIYILGAWHYPKKLNRIIYNLDTKKDSA